MTVAIGGAATASTLGARATANVEKRSVASKRASTIRPGRRTIRPGRRLFAMLVFMVALTLG
jgi:hypothetical protein